VLMLSDLQPLSAMIIECDMVPHWIRRMKNLIPRTKKCLSKNNSRKLWTAIRYSSGNFLWWARCTKGETRVAAKGPWAKPQTSSDI
jgi:hypothetical protein